ncbi:MAG: phenylalanine--tRNA ligase subunit alpha [Planctomycetes bacterium]|nr:phenylalanine--tRNA ligase subunit alpha [Planctomycetota bacterium]
MALADFLADLDSLLTSANAAFAAAADSDSLEVARVEFLGAKSGRLKTVQQGLGKIDKPDKPAAGKKLNEVKKAITAAFEQAQQNLSAGGGEDAGDDGFDPTLPGRRARLGHIHPITQTIEQLKEIMGRLGFSVAEGPEVEDKWHNFDALNIPPIHPARSELDNFYLATAEKAAGEPMLLRSQTSTVQIRVMEKTPPPVRIISLGRVYRPDTADATHYPMFHQIEGLMVDRGVTMADLKSVLRLFASSFLGGDVHIRFRPSFFPFTEPSVEVDISWQGGWMEMGGAGMIDPNVLRAVGYDPDEVTGFAFGLGVERICMSRHQVTDIREFYRNDVRFLEQF